MSRHPTRLFAALLVLLVGCAPPSEYLALRGTNVPPAGARVPESREPHVQPPAEVSVEGWVVVAGAQGPSLSLEFTNHGAYAVTFSALVDAYVLTTRHGRFIPLEVQDFLDYPSVLKPGGHAAVILTLPHDLPPQDMKQLTVTIDAGRTTLALDRFGLPPSPAAMRVRDPARNPSASGPAQADELVPVTLSFQQELGMALKLRAHWMGHDAVVTMVPGDQQTFEVAPGPRELVLDSELRMLSATNARVPLVISVEAPLHVAITARATLSGVALHVVAWDPKTTVFDHTFGPDSAR